MPLRKEIPSLVDLCINNITRNIVIHGEIFEKNRANENIYGSYKTLQFLFSDDLLQRLFVLLAEEETDKDLQKLKNFIFPASDCPERQYKGQDYWPCLKLLFNGGTTCILSRWCTKQIDEMSKSVLSFITNRCKNLRRINDVFCISARGTLVEAIPRFHNLVEVDFGFIADEEILKKILKTCPFIKCLSADGSGCFTDLFLLTLCKHHPPQDEFVFCPENGQCSNSGKHLERLHLMLSETTVNAAGIACALQHLPFLRSFYPLPPKGVVFERDEILPDVLKGILSLHSATTGNGRPPVMLELTALYFYKNLNLEELRTVLKSCPNLKAIQVDLSIVDSAVFTLSSFISLKELHLYRPINQILNSASLEKLLSVRGNQIKELSFERSDEPLDLICINNILSSCSNLRSLTFWLIEIADRNYRNIAYLPQCVAKLENITFKIITHAHDRYYLPPHTRYFYKLLSEAKAVTHLTINSDFEAKVFFLALGENDFYFLEELRVRCSVSARLPYMKLVNANNKLRTLDFVHDPDDINVIRYKDIVRNNNYELEILP